MGTKLRRTALSTPYANMGHDIDEFAPHPGLLLQRGLEAHSDESKEAKTEHIALVCDCGPDNFYRHTFARWKRYTSSESRFRSVELDLRTRLFIGLTGGGMLETGCMIGHSHGAPYIPGSTVKGAVRAFVRQRLEGEERAICVELFGSDAEDHPPSGLSGLILCHDAWWVPGRKRLPMIKEIVTTHHLDYYGKDGDIPATDFDSPVPNAQIAVRGRFNFVIEGPHKWLDIAEQMLVDALTTAGIGAKTTSGYGQFFANSEPAQSDSCAWVDQEVRRIMKMRQMPDWMAVEGIDLARSWRRIDEPDLKRDAYLDIQRRWRDQVFGKRLRRAARRSRKIYEEYDSDFGSLG